MLIATTTTTPTNYASGADGRGRRVELCAAAADPVRGTAAGSLAVDGRTDGPSALSDQRR